MSLWKARMYAELTLIRKLIDEGTFDNFELEPIENKIKELKELIII